MSKRRCELFGSDLGQEAKYVSRLSGKLPLGCTGSILRFHIAPLTFAAVNGRANCPPRSQPVPASLVTGRAIRSWSASP